MEWKAAGESWAAQVGHLAIECWRASGDRHWQWLVAVSTPGGRMEIIDRGEGRSVSGVKRKALLRADRLARDTIALWAAVAESATTELASLGSQGPHCRGTV